MASAFGAAGIDDADDVDDVDAITGREADIGDSVGGDGGCIGVGAKAGITCVNGMA